MIYIYVQHCLDAYVPGLNQILNGWFDEYLNESYPDIDRKKIMPLTIISLDTLVCFPELLTGKLEQNLSAYSEHLYPQQYLRNRRIEQSQMSETYAESTISFDSWLTKQNTTDWPHKITQFLEKRKIVTS